ncbi:LytTR family transcriptional regulator [Psychroflexus gondwanensis]|jgi:DNA-binding LytR/AlgR family response regulator|uniref:LytR/AlgR family response regulator transcription factor n=1 Tax=Psychroflexus gondwanensis TaxID=251 RepID=UPI0011BE2C8D|nr:LytTR family DNA-binding domain-containing protein [Psychroflexus gondwanensis]TXE15851.1 LytTR family transcriptional regulator [Psychroflexus gondwanensis]
MRITLQKLPDLIILNLDIVEDISNLIYSIKEYCINEPLFVALSSKEEKAMIGYKYGFADFLLKPCDEISIRKCLLKHRKKNLVKSSSLICLKSYKDYRDLNFDEIMFLKADNNTNDFYLKNERIIGAYKTMKVFEDNLPSSFLRVHKSFVTNSDCFSIINYGKNSCEIGHTKKIPFTKTYLDNIDTINSNLLKNTSNNNLNSPLIIPIHLQTLYIH